jgi:hypothetical protein
LTYEPSIACASTKAKGGNRPPRYGLHYLVHILTLYDLKRNTLELRVRAVTLSNLMSKGQGPKRADVKPAGRVGRVGRRFDVVSHVFESTVTIIDQKDA